MIHPRSLPRLLSLGLLVACCGCSKATPEAPAPLDASSPFAGRFEVAGESRAIADAIAFPENDQGYDEIVVVFYDRPFDRAALMADGRVSRWDFTGMAGAYLMLSIGRDKGALRGYHVLSAQDPPAYEGTTDAYDNLSGRLKLSRLDATGVAGSFAFGAHQAQFNLPITVGDGEPAGDPDALGS